MPACREVMDVLAARFNATTDYRWGRIIDFLKLHYVLTQRDRQRVLARQPAAGDDSRASQNLLLLWSHQSPWYHDEFDRIEEVFPAASYQYVSTAWAFAPKSSPTRWAASENAERAMRENIVQTERLLRGFASASRAAFAK